MPSDKLRRDFAPEPDVIEFLDSIPLMRRSNVVNDALREYRDNQRTKDLPIAILDALQRIERKLDKVD